MYSDSGFVNTEIDLEKYIAELKQPWKTMGDDMSTAKYIISKHSDAELELLSVSENPFETSISFPDWQSELEKEYIQQYGLNSGKNIFKKVIMRFYQLSKGTAQELQ